MGFINPFFYARIPSDFTGSTIEVEIIITLKNLYLFIKLARLCHYKKAHAAGSGCKPENTEKKEIFYE